MATDIVDLFIDLGKDPAATIKSADFRRAPVIKSFYSDPIRAYTESIKEFYETYGELVRDYNTMKAKGEITGLHEYPKADEYRRYQTAKTYLEKKTKQIKKAQLEKAPRSTLNAMALDKIEFVRRIQGQLPLKDSITDTMGKEYYIRANRSVAKGRLDDAKNRLRQQVMGSIELPEATQELTEKMHASLFTTAVDMLDNNKLDDKSKVELIDTILNTSQQVDFDVILADVINKMLLK